MRVHPKSATLRAVVLLASAAALVMSSFGVQASSATARQAADGQQLTVAGDTDVSARKRYRRGNGNAAGLAMMGMMIGTVGAVIANQQRREAYERAYAAPRYYGGGHPRAYSYEQPYAQPQHHVQPHHHVRRNPAAFNSWNNPYDDPTIQRLNAQTPGVINYGPPRIGF